VSDSTRYVWLRLGDHRAELERAVAACAAEHGGRGVGDPSVSARADSTGQKFTCLEAAGSWWLAYMRVHGSDWVGPATTDMVRDLLHPRPTLGDAR
jgi:hypothetical protein